MKNVLLKIFLSFLMSLLSGSAWGYTFSEFKDYISQKRSLYVISEDVDLGGEQLDLPFGKIVKFAGGSIYNGTLNVNNADIVSPSYQIFGKDLIVTGQFGNRQIYPEWFDDDLTNGLQKALDCAGETEVLAGNFTLTRPINIMNDGTKFTCLGNIKVADSCLSAINLGGNNMTNKIWKMTLNPKAYKDLNRVALSITDTLRDSYIELGEVVFDVVSGDTESRYAAFDIVKKSGHEPLVENNKFSFQLLNLDTPSQNGVCFNIQNACFCNNRIQGGRLEGATGIKIHGGKVSKNIFTNIGLEGITRSCLDLSGLEDNRFEYLRMSESFPNEKSIRLNKCRGNFFHFKSTLSEKDFQLSQNGINKVLASFNLFYNPDRDYGQHGINAAYTSGNDLFYSSISENSGSIKELTFDSKESCSQITDTLNYDDLCLYLHEDSSELRELTKTIRIKVAANRRVILDLKRGMSSIPLNQSMFILLDLEDDRISSFEILTDSNRQSAERDIIYAGRVPSGTYQLLWDVITDDGTDHKRWNPALFRISQ